MSSYLTMATKRGTATLGLAALGAVGALAAGASPADTRLELRPGDASQPLPGRLTARPRGGGGNCAPGEHRLRLGGGRTALMRVTAGGGGRGKALLLALHGAAGVSRDGLYAFRGGWSEAGLVMVAPAAGGLTWSVLQTYSDTDLPSVDRALARVFARCRIDPRRVAVGGFSDGATYALTLGLVNGDLFRGVIALSPGGLGAPTPVGRPRVFIAHGTLDDVLPVRTSDLIVRELRESGYRVTYRRFRGGHEARPEISRAAVRWFLRR